MQCTNNLKQIGLAAQTHNDSLRFFPGGGFGYGWIGDPDQGFGAGQPGGFLFNILPFMDAKTIYNLGKGNNMAGRMLTAQTVMETFNCPTRRTRHFDQLLFGVFQHELAGG